MNGPISFESKRLSLYVIPASMSALVLFGKEDMRLVERSVPTPGVDEALIEVGSVGVCGSDKHLYYEGRDSSNLVKSPLIMGHEFGGRIVAVGDEREAGRLGQRVSVEPLMPDWDSSEALHGRYNIDPSQKFFGVPGTDGALQQYLRVPLRNIHVIPDSISDDAAAMVETISVALSGVAKAGVTFGKRILTTGGGPIGLFAAQLAFLHGAASVTLVEPHEQRRSTARTYGCEVVSALEDVDDNYDALIECSGAASARTTGIMKVRPGGKAVFIGVGAQEAAIPMPAIIEREVSLQGVMRYAFTWPAVIALLASGKIDTNSLVSRRLTLASAPDAWTKPFAAEVKSIIRPND